MCVTGMLDSFRGKKSGGNGATMQGRHQGAGKQVTGRSPHATSCITIQLCIKIELAKEGEVLGGTGVRRFLTAFFFVTHLLCCRMAGTIMK